MITVMESLQTACHTVPGLKLEAVGPPAAMLISLQGVAVLYCCTRVPIAGTLAVTASTCICLCWCPVQAGILLRVSPSCWAPVVCGHFGPLMMVASCICPYLSVLCCSLVCRVVGSWRCWAAAGTHRGIASRRSQRLSGRGVVCFSSLCRGLCSQIDLGMLAC